MVNYSKSMIYKLCCKDPNITSIYIGSTTNFYRRKSEHKSDCNNENSKDYNNYKYQFIRDNGGFKNWDMILIENVSCNSKREIEKIERDYIDKLKPSLNTYKSYTTEQEKKEYEKEYYENNKTKINEKRNQYFKKYREDNKKKINQKINCEFCNCLSSKLNMKRHQRSIKCLKFQFIDLID